MKLASSERFRLRIVDCGLRIELSERCFEFQSAIRNFSTRTKQASSYEFPYRYVVTSNSPSGRISQRTQPRSDVLSIIIGGG